MTTEVLDAMEGAGAMTRVTDEDLELLKKYGAWTTDAGERLRHAQCVDNVISELLALRKVADAAVKLEEAMVGIPCECSDKSCELLCNALREAGL